MRLEVDSSHFIDFNYKVNEDYLVDFNINMIGMNEVIPRELNFMNLEWQMKTPQTEKSKEIKICIPVYIINILLIKMILIT